MSVQTLVGSPNRETPAWSIWPTQPTEIDVVEAWFGKPLARAVQAFRVVNDSLFYAVIYDGLPGALRYRFGVLPPGDYTFVLYRAERDQLCHYQPLTELRFTVRPVAHPASPLVPGLITLFVEASDREAANRVIGMGRPVLETVLFNWLKVDLIPGLESIYHTLIASRPEVETVELDYLGYIPECPPPWGEAFLPGRLVVEIDPAVTLDKFKSFLNRTLPPVVVSWEPGFIPGRPAIGRALVKVPPGLEQFFLKWYLQQPGIRGGGIVRNNWDGVNRHYLEEVSL